MYKTSPSKELNTTCELLNGESLIDQERSIPKYFF